MNKHTYWVLWTYVANYSSLMKVEADSPEQAKEKVCDWYGPEFLKKAHIYVFDKEPVYTNLA